MYYYIFYRELIICGDFGTGGVYFRGMDGYLLSSGFYHPCILFLPVCEWMRVRAGFGSGVEWYNGSYHQSRTLSSFFSIHFWCGIHIFIFIYLPVCALVLCLWFRGFHLCLTFTYIHIYIDFSNFASSSFLFVYVYVDFYIYSLVFSTYMYICLIFIYFNLFCYYVYWLCPVVFVYSADFPQNEDKLWDIFGRSWPFWYIICLYFSIFMILFVGC